jgi:Tfp pilus assembly protein PilE
VSTLPLKSVRAARLPLLILIPAILAFIAYSVFPRGGRTRPEEAVAATRLLDIYAAQKSYAAAHNGSYAESLDALQLPPPESQYLYSLAVAKDAKGRVTAYLATADPRAPGKAGTRYFSVDQTGTIHYEFMRPPNKWSPTLQR